MTKPITVRVGDLVEYTPQTPWTIKGKKDKQVTYEVLALSYGQKNRNGETGWHMQLRNVRGTKKWWCPISAINAPQFRHYKPLSRR
jgi:hypothetical protein